VVSTRATGTTATVLQTPHSPSLSVRRSMLQRRRRPRRRPYDGSGLVRYGDEGDAYDADDEEDQEHPDAGFLDAIAERAFAPGSDADLRRHG
jgi:hypothetical protein